MASVLENIAGVTANAVASLAAMSIGAKDDTKDAAQTSAAEGRRLYIGNLAYAATETELKQSFDGYAVVSFSTFRAIAVV